MAKPVPKVDLFIAGAWVEVTSRTRKASVQISIGRTPGAKQAESVRVVCVIMNDDGWLTEGNPLSPWYPDAARGCPIRVSAVIGGTAVERATATINTMKLVNESPGIARVHITATGTLGQIGQGSDPLDSALTRALRRRTDNMAWWPLEDGTTSTQAASGITTGTPMTATGSPAFASATGPAGTAPLLDLAANGGRLTGTVPAGATPPVWRMQILMRFASGGGGTAGTIMQWKTLGATYTQWTLSVTSGSILTATATGPGGASDTLSALSSKYDGEWHRVEVGCRYNEISGDLITYLDIDSATHAVGPFSLGVGETLARPTLVIVNPNSTSGTHMPAVGHLRFTDVDVDFGAPDPLAAPEGMDGYAGEMAHDRVIRLCEEEGIAYEVAGTVSTVMGPQRRDTLGANLQDCETADHGLLHDGGTAGAVVYVTNDELTNRGIELTLPGAVIADGLTPIWDNLLTANDVTSSRTGGSSARVTDEAHIVKVKKRWPDTATVNVDDDDQLADDAGWLVWVGTAAGPRYDEVGITGHDPAGEAIAAQLAAITVGDRIAAAQASLTAQHPPGGLDQLVIGLAEMLDKVEWRIWPRTVPYAPYLVGVLAEDAGDDDPYLGWLESDSCLLNAAVDADDTSWQVNSTPLWTTDADDFPVEVLIGGEPVTATAVAGGSNPQTWTVVRSTTLAKEHGTDEPVDLVHPIVLTIV